jgi:uncharacterized membrane-anchored protein
MPESTQDRLLDQLLEYGEEPQGDEFVLDVMHRVRREQGRRKVILFVFGLIGALFGLTGAVLLSEPIARALANLPAMGTTQVALFVVAAVATYAWFMNEDIDLTV